MLKNWRVFFRNYHPTLSHYPTIYLCNEPSYVAQGGLLSPASEGWGRYCFHRCVSVNGRGGGGGLVVSGLFCQRGRGYSCPGPGGGGGGGMPQSGPRTRHGQDTARAVCLLHFDAGLSCLHLFTPEVMAQPLDSTSDNYNGPLVEICLNSLALLRKAPSTGTQVAMGLYLSLFQMSFQHQKFNNP